MTNDNYPALRNYVVRWEIDAPDCDSPRTAAAWALNIQRNPSNMATVFDVQDEETGTITRVDLLDTEDENVSVTEIFCTDHGGDVPHGHDSDGEPTQP